MRHVIQFADAMAERLEANDDKSGWWNLTPKQCLARARQEMGELQRAIEKGETPERITREAADVANFLAFLSANYADDAADKAALPARRVSRIEGGKQ